jgi:t-SNARE complex subunit (syntaxin)
MPSTFINPVLNPDAKLGVNEFDEEGIVRFWQGSSEAEVEVLIRAVYRQVLGNAHVMESERLTVLESQLKQGEVSVREFVRQVAKSDLYRSRFFENCPRYRAIELNFKHLLGRAPESYEETTHHSQLLDTAGYDLEIDSYIDSEEYLDAFGEDIVPYYRGYKTQTGKKMVGFTHLFQLLRGASSSDKDGKSGNRSRLNRSLLTNTPSKIVPPTGASIPWQPVVQSPAYKQPVSKLPGFQTQSSRSVGLNIDRQHQYQSYQVFTETPPVELWNIHSAEEVETVMRAAYRQVLGNAYVMESERLAVPESQLKQGNISVREFVRQIAKSELYRSRFFDTCYRYRAIELNFKHLLGRAPENFDEMRQHSAILDQGGFEAEIDSYINSDEYQTAFGENVVPYYRILKSQKGKSLLEFTNLFQLLRSASGSDQDPSANQPRLTRSLILNRAYGVDRPRDAKDILAELFKPTEQLAGSRSLTPIVSETEQALQRQQQEQADLIIRLQTQLAELRPFASLGSAITRQGQFAVAATVESTFTPRAAMPQSEGNSSELQRNVEAQATLIANLQSQVAEARSLAAIGEFRANKWRRR